MFLLVALVALSLGCTHAAPHPPCAAPHGIIPAVAESMCSSVVVPRNHTTGVAVRSYGTPSSETLVTDFTPSNFPYGEVLNISVSNILLYLAVANAARVNILANRTVPITIRPPTANPDGWLVSMMVSTAAFPNPALIPTPNNFEMHLEPMAQRLFAALTFDTDALPSEEEFKAKCAELAQGVPEGYSSVEEGWTPTYVLYSPRDATRWTSECWVQVKAN
jgi:hypothetical protein